MTVVILILKIIGILLLVLLGLILFLVLLVLFVPVRYRVSGSCHNSQVTVKVRVSWLLHLFILALERMPEDSESWLRIFGIRMKPKKVDNWDDFAENIEEKPPDREREKPASKEKYSPKEDAFSEEKSSPKEKHDAGKNNLFTKISGRICEIRQKIRSFLRRIQRALRRINETAAKARAVFADEHFRPALGFLAGRAGWLLRRVSPKRFRLALRFSTGAPDTTGEALGVLAMFPAVYRNRWDVTPDFTAEQAYAEAEFDVRGRAFLFHFAGLLITVLANKDCRGLYGAIKNIL